MTPKPLDQCRLDGCTRPRVYAVSCSTHRKRLLKYGTYEPYPTVEEKLWSRVDRSGGPDACWPYMSTRRAGGYGAIGFTQDLLPHGTTAHRLAYRLANGPFDLELYIDHKCYNPPCCNPSHLQAVTPQKNGENLSGAPRGSGLGIRGVTWYERDQCYRVRAGHMDKEYHGGYFADLEEAKLAAIALRNSIFTNNLRDRSA